MDDARETVKVRAYSPGKHPILVVEAPGGGLRTAYFETGYSLSRSKPVGEEWLRENAIGRHGFVGMDPPKDVPADSLQGFVEGEILGNA